MSGERMMFKWIWLAAFIACIPAANWLIGNLGAKCIPNGPCLIPVGFGFGAPTGVLLIGAALVLRDIVQRTLGKRVVLGAIVAGAALSGAVAPPQLVIASAVAFLLSELADFAVYTPLERRGLVLAVLASSAVGLVIDSALFLWLAFGSFKYLEGQVIGKAWAVLAAVIVLALMRYDWRMWFHRCSGTYHCKTCGRVLR